MRIAMWSGPRNISTAMMYSFAAREDCDVVDEPFYAAYLTMTGSISLSENPRIAVSAPSRTQSVEVELRDTDGTVRRASRRFGGY